MKRFVFSALAAAAALLVGTAAHAGPVIIDGTDSADHGAGTLAGNFAIQATNTDGWEYMQRALTNLGSTVSSTVAKVVTVIGTQTGTTAGNAITSAFNLAGLAGWTINYVDGAGAIATALGSLSTTTTGILYLSTAGLVAGDMDAGELAAVNGKAAQIASFVGGAGNAALGGALFAQGETGAGEFDWLSTLISGIVTTDVGAGGAGTGDITLTAAGATAFPGLTNTDLAGADPWHGYFSGNLGSLSVLGDSPFGGVSRNVIIGGGVGTTITNIPEPGSLALVALAGLGLLAASRRQRAK